MVSYRNMSDEEIKGNQRISAKVDRTRKRKIKNLEGISKDS